MTSAVSVVNQGPTRFRILSDSQAKKVPVQNMYTKFVKTLNADWRIWH